MGGPGRFLATHAGGDVVFNLLREIGFNLAG